MKKTYLFILSSLVILAIAGCSTIKGLGDDIATVGGWLMRGSDAVQEGGTADK